MNNKINELNVELIHRFIAGVAYKAHFYTEPLTITYLSKINILTS